MKIIVLSVVAAALTGCATVADVRAKPAFLTADSQRSVQQLASCVSDQWSRRSGNVAATPRERGTSLSLTYMVYSSSMVAAVVDIDDLGSTRRINVHARKGDANSKLRREISSCL